MRFSFVNAPLHLLNISVRMQTNRKLTTAPVEINVKELPAGAPSSFSGAVGRFTMEATPPASNFTANSAATYTVKISGFPMLSVPLYRKTRRQNS